MEDTLRVSYLDIIKKQIDVLILVLMEDTLRVLQRHGSLQHWVS